MVRKKIHIHFMGIGGSALAGVAILTKKMGYEVSGCDLFAETYYSKSLKQVGIEPFLGHNERHLKGIDLLVISPAVLAVNPTHPEVEMAKKKGILLTWQEFVGKYLQVGKTVIAVAGAHGKSTTTALAGLVLEAAGLDPSVVVGAIVPEWQTSARFGRSKYFVVEADEYNLNFLNYSPSIIILTNIEFDHPEYFKNFGEFKTAFKQFIKKLIGPKILIANQDDEGVMGMIGDMEDKKELEDIEIKFYSSEKGVKTTNKDFTLKLFGVHNLSNALAVAELAEYLRIKRQFLHKVFSAFAGLKRRMELISEAGGIKVFDDYAVHPTAVRATLKALRQKYPHAKIWAIFEPHQYSRLRVFMKDFVKSLSIADKMIVTKAYAGREKNVWEVKETELVRLIGSKAEFLEDFEKIAERIRKDSKKNEVVVIFGAGDSYKIAPLIEEKMLGIKNEVSLAGFTTFRIGGPADYFAEAADEGRIKDLINWAKKKNLPCFILGGGSNLLIADRGYGGLVIRIRNSQFAIRNSIVTCEAGVSLARLVEETAKRGLTGLEFAAGIPGTVGGAIKGNAGAWQQSLGDVVERVRILSEEGDFKWLEKSACNFGYRQSRFKKSGEVVMAVELRLKEREKVEIRQQIKDYLARRNGQPQEPSAGCIFVNPRPRVAGQLIDQAGLKGKMIGGAKISEKHANFIVNTGGATAKEVVQLIKLIQKAVKEKFGVQLKEEIQLVGFKKEEDG